MYGVWPPSAAFVNFRRRQVLDAIQSPLGHSANAGNIEYVDRSSARATEKRHEWPRRLRSADAAALDPFQSDLVASKLFTREEYTGLHYLLVDPLNPTASQRCPSPHINSTTTRVGWVESGVHSARSSSRCAVVFLRRSVVVVLLRRSVVVVFRFEIVTYHGLQLLPYFCLPQPLFVTVIIF
ncbi:hypothetical protein QR680_005175 [Steinernema hermaphroditum]|uniref:Uncharacterized protein n=1 Tax=Steinernema hermaphroditum TaxID=289476 RepID=A0AA39LV76_9BILA|nr:hypothetical protein QR680_005175 [Steinernema hermaphroditum]